MDGDRIVGYGPDYFSAVYREVGLKAVEWDHIFDGLNAGEYDAIASSVTITPERRAAFDFTIKAMAAGDVDAVICEDVVEGSFLKAPAYMGKIKVAAVINTPGAEELYGAAIRKGNLNVLIPLNDGIKAVRAKGIDTELRRKWVGDF